MSLHPDKRFYLLLIGMSASTLVLNPNSYDPSSIPKWTISWITCSLLLLPSLYSLWNNGNLSRLLVASCSSLVVTALCLALTSNDTYQGIYGTLQRYNGALLITLLISLFLITTASYKSSFLVPFIRIFLVLAVIEILVGVSQHNGFQLIKAQNLYSPILGTFGNPNHLSAFLGFGMVVSLYVILNHTKILDIVLLSVFILPSSLFIFWKSQSIQGLFSFAAGATIFILLRLRKKQVLFLSASTLTIFLAGISVAGMANKGPLARFLFQDSNLYRGDYWRGALAAIKERPLFGFGPDQFADAYLNLRDNSAIQRRTTIVVDNAHNWPLQIGATYGLFFLLLFVLFLACSTYFALRTIRKHGHLNSYALPFALWISSLTQTLVSVEHSVITGWGFVFGGAFVSGIFVKLQDKAALTRKKQIRKIHSPTFSMIHVFSIIVSLAIISPPILCNSFLTTLDRKYSTQGSIYDAREIASQIETRSVIGHGDRKLWLIASNIRYVAGDVAGAEYLLDQTIEHFPGENEAYNYLAQLEMNRGRVSAALDIRKTLAEISPRNVENQKMIMSLAIQLNDKKSYETAKFIYTSILGDKSLPDDLSWNN